jgi:hypothetical protein
MAEAGHKLMKAHQKEMETNQERMTALMDANLEKMRACLEATKATIKASQEEMRAEIKTGLEEVMATELEALSRRDRGRCTTL